MKSPILFGKKLQPHGRFAPVQGANVQTFNVIEGGPTRFKLA